MLKAIVITLAVILLVLPQPAQADGPVQYSGNVPQDPEAEYYRGIYDACIFAAAYARFRKADAVGACHQAVDQARAMNWYKQPSPGWQMQRVPAGWGRET